MQERLSLSTRSWGDGGSRQEEERQQKSLAINTYQQTQDSLETFLNAHTPLLLQWHTCQRYFHSVSTSKAPRPSLWCALYVVLRVFKKTLFSRLAFSATTWDNGVISPQCAHTCVLGRLWGAPSFLSLSIRHYDYCPKWWCVDLLCVCGVCHVFFEARVVAHTLQEVEMDTANGALMDFWVPAQSSP